VRSLMELGRYFSTHPLTCNAPHWAWTRFVNWQIRSRLQEEVVVEWLGGQKLAVRRGMTGATGNIYAGLHEFSDMAFVLHFLRKGDLFLDIGANIGSFTVLAAGVCKANSWSFEPDPATIRHLQRNISINGLDERVNIYAMALGDYNGEAELTVGRDSVNQVLVSKGERSQTIEIRKLDDLVGMGEPVMLKIDVEGYEDNVLRGAKGVLGLTSLKAIEIETLTSDVISLLGYHGFERMYYNPFERKISPDAFEFNSSNALYIRDRKAVSDRLASANEFRVLNACI